MAKAVHLKTFPWYSSSQGPGGAGTPQGGVISPLLANIYLHSFDEMFLLSGIRGTLVRYADDLVILLRGGGAKVLKKVRVMLARLGLELHEDETRITDTRRLRRLTHT